MTVSRPYKSIGFQFVCFPATVIRNRRVWHIRQTETTCMCATISKKHNFQADTVDCCRFCDYILHCWTCRSLNMCHRVWAVYFCNTHYNSGSTAEMRRWVRHILKKLPKSHSEHSHWYIKQIWNDLDNFEKLVQKCACVIRCACVIKVSAVWANIGRA